MIEAETIDAASTIKLLAGLEALYATTAPIHVFLDHARYHHAKIVQEWLSQPGRRIVLHFVPSYCPHLNPIERLWALMHQHLTHNKTYPTCREIRPTQYSPPSPPATRSPGDGANFAIGHRQLPASSSPQNFGFWREPSIAFSISAFFLFGADSGSTCCSKAGVACSPLVHRRSFALLLGPSGYVAREGRAGAFS